MKRNSKFNFIVILLSMSLLTAHCSLLTDVHGDTHNAATCSYSEVSSAITAASAGDTVIVPAGSATWSSGLSITKGVYIIGAGIDTTVITSNYTGSYLITYNPSNWTANDPFRLSGFTFDFADKCSGLILGQWSKNAPFVIQTKVRIDHIRFYRPKVQAIWNCCEMTGVMDNNIFDNISYPIRNGNGDGGSDGAWWNYFTITFGAADDNMYYEDNTFTGIGGSVCDCQFAGRYVYRYNDINGEDSDHFPLFDLHGNQPINGLMPSCFGGEVYGNDINSGSHYMSLVDQRAGKMLIFCNNNNNTNSTDVYIQVREEYDDSITPPAVSPISGQPQHVSDSYYWNNRKNLTGSLNTIVVNGQVGDIPKADRDYFAYTAAFSGTSGMGCGTLAARPATCTSGVGYWATNQSCSNLTGMVGVNPATPISGTLYKCTATNTWTAYYTPLAYPHPLRGGVDATPPGAPGAVRDGTSAISDFVFAYSTSQLSANWEAGTDVESGISGYKYAIGTAQGATDITNGWLTSGTNLAVTKTGLSLTVGTTYYFSVKAVNGASLESVATNSNGQYSRIWVPDTTGPVMGAVRDGAGADIDATGSQTQLQANWDAAAEPESAVNLYSYAIGTTPGTTNIRGWTTVGVNRSVTATGLGLTNGQAYYFSVKAQNTDGYWGAAVNSDGQYVLIYTYDTTGPVMGAVRDGVGQDINTTNSQVQLQANWDAAAEPETAVNLYSYAIGTTAGGTNVRGWTTIGVNRSITATGLGLTGGQAYYFSVKAQNTDGYWGAAANSNGQTVIGDTSPPGAPGAVRDGTSATADSGFTFSTTQLAANWNAAIDNESGISNYQFSIGTTPGGTQTSGWATIGNVLSVTKTGLSLSIGTTYYFSVKAQNGNGLQSSAVNSNGQYVVKVDTSDTTPPTTPAQVRDGLGTDTGYTYSKTQLSANWDDSTDTGSGIARYQYAIGTSPAGTDVVNWTNTADGINTEITKAGLNLTVGTTYYFSVRAVNGVGLQGGARNSDGQVVLEDSSLVAPVISNVVVSATASGVAITWNTDKACTGYVEYGQTPVYGFFSAPGTSFVTGHAADLTEVTAGTQYHYRIIVRDAGYVESITPDSTFVAPGDLQNGIIAYPNPCSISKDRKVTFLVGAGVKAEVKIYTVTGRLVKEIRDEAGTGEITWDATNQAGEKVLTGVYLYKVTAPGGDRTTGKLAIVK